jgi:hypothetical protein
MLKKLNKITGYKFKMTSLSVIFNVHNKHFTNFYTPDRNNKLRPVYFTGASELLPPMTKQYVSIAVHFQIKPIKAEKVSTDVYFLDILRKINKVLNFTDEPIVQRNSELIYRADVYDEENIAYTLIAYPISTRTGSKGFNCSIIKTVYVKRFL